MIVLLDTSTPTCKLSLVSESARVFEWEAGRALSAGLLRFIQDCLSEEGYSWGDITGIGVYRGPGSFTGLRIGISVLNALADTRELPIVGATGENWTEVALERLRRSESDAIVLPEYGSDANITTPRK